MKEQSQAHVLRILFTPDTGELFSPLPTRHTALMVIPKAKYWKYYSLVYTYCVWILLLRSQQYWKNMKIYKFTDGTLTVGSYRKLDTFKFYYLVKSKSKRKHKHVQTMMTLLERQFDRME